MFDHQINHHFPKNRLCLRIVNDWGPRIIYRYSWFGKERPTALFEFENKISEMMSQRSLFNERSMWLLFVKNEEERLEKVLTIIQGFDDIQLNSEIYIIKYSQSQIDGLLEIYKTNRNEKLICRG